MRIEICRGYAPKGRYQPKIVRPMDEQDELLFIHCSNGSYEVAYRDWEDVKMTLRYHGVKDFSIVDNS